MGNDGSTVSQPIKKFEISEPLLVCIIIENDVAVPTLASSMKKKIYGLRNNVKLFKLIQFICFGAAVKGVG